MNESPLWLAGVEVYFENLDAAKEFYQNILGLKVTDEEPGATQDSTVKRASSV